MIELNAVEMNKVISGFQIPVKPKILTQLQDLLDEEEPCIDSIATLISSDVSLSSSILKIINSPCYGMNRTISEIKQSVMILGLKTINSLVTALMLKESFKGEACISLERFWDDSLDIANAMAFIGNKVKNKIPIDMLYTIGLFVNCGIPMLAIKYDNYGKVIVKANSLKVNPVIIEEKVYKTNHAVLGYYLGTSWNLPKEICNLILNHHDLMSLSRVSGSDDQLCFAVLKAAENLVERAKRHNTSQDWEGIKDNVLDILGINEDDYEDIEEDFIDIFK